MSREDVAEIVITRMLAKVREVTLKECASQVLGHRPSVGVTSCDRVLGGGEEVGS